MHAITLPHECLNQFLFENLVRKAMHHFISSCVALRRAASCVSDSSIGFLLF